MYIAFELNMSHSVLVPDLLVMGAQIKPQIRGSLFTPDLMPKWIVGNGRAGKYSINLESLYRRGEKSRYRAGKPVVART